MVVIRSEHFHLRMFKNKIPQVNLSSDSDGVVMTTA